MRRFILAACLALAAAAAYAQVSGTLQSAATANGNGAPLRVLGMATVGLTVNCSACAGGTTVNFQVSGDGSNWLPVAGALSGATVPTYATSTTTAGFTGWQFNVAGWQFLRATVSNYSAGTVTVTGTAVIVSMRALKTPFGYIVATNGNDSTGTGSLAQPFLTTHRCHLALLAQSAVTACYHRAGLYQLSGAGEDHTKCFSNGTSQPNAFLLNVAGDAGTTYSYYPPDGFGSAIIDGGASSSSTGMAIGFCVLAQNVTINGLQMRNFQESEVVLVSDADTGNAPSNDIVVYNIFRGTYTANDYWGAVSVNCYAGGNTIAGNYIHDTAAPAIALETPNCSASKGLLGNVVYGNLIGSTCSAITDCGPIYIQDFIKPSPGAPYITITGNYLTLGNGHSAIYLDDGTSGVVASNNVLFAGKLQAGVQDCAFIHGGANNQFTGNICDLRGQGAATITPSILTQQQTTNSGGSGWPMTGNTWQGNIVLCKTSSANCGQGYKSLSPTPAAPATVSGNTYFNFGAGGTVFSGANGSGVTGDTSPTTANPNLPCSATLGHFFGPPGLVPPAFPPEPSWGCWVVGAYSDYNSAAASGVGGFEQPARAFEAWLGIPTDSIYSVAYTVGAFRCTNPNCANAMTNTFNIGLPGSNYWFPSSRQNVVWSVALTACDFDTNQAGNNTCTAGHMVPLTGTNSVASGFEDDVFNTVFSTIHNKWPNAIIRIGWEMNLACCTGGWLVGQAGGSTSNGVAYIAAYRHVAAIAQSYGFKLDWCPGLGDNAAPAENFYPGDAYVDIIGADFYQYNSTQGWAPYLTASHGFAWHGDYAARHGKSMAYDEFGCGGTSGSDAGCADIITNLGAWLGSNPVKYFTFWNSTSFPLGSDQVCDNGTVGNCGSPYLIPQSAAAFLKQFQFYP